jgi:hypothetical protein
MTLYDIAVMSILLKTQFILISNTYIVGQRYHS